MSDTRVNLTALVLLTIFASLSWKAARLESPTIDEPIHLTGGYTDWVTGHFFLDPVHPPLMRLWAALPLTVMHLKTFYPPPLSVMQLHLGLTDWLLNGNTVSSDSLIAAGRAMMLIIGVGLGILVWRWGTEFDGPLTGLMALALYSFSPTVLAFASLVTLDLPSAAFSVLTLYTLWRYIRVPSTARAGIAGLALGANLMTKFTGWLFVPLSVVLSVVEKKRPRSRHLVYFIAAVAGMVLLAYRGNQLGWLLQGVVEVPRVFQFGSGQFFAGHLNVGHPWLWFMTACFLLKTPLPFLLVAILGVVFAVRQKSAEWRSAALWFLVPGLFCLIVVSFSNFQMGARRVLILYPLLSLWGGMVLSRLWQSGPLRRSAVVVLVGLCAGETGAVYPNYLSYANPLIGGPSGAWHYFADCNLDWGQGLKALGEYLKSEGSPHIYLGYRGGGSPDGYGIHYVLIDPQAGGYLQLREEPAFNLVSQPKVLLAISESLLVGAWSEGIPAFTWLQSRKPVYIALNSIWVYDLTNDRDAHRHLSDVFHDQKRPDLAEREHRWATAENRDVDKR